MSKNTPGIKFNNCKADHFTSWKGLERNEKGKKVKNVGLLKPIYFQDTFGKSKKKTKQNKASKPKWRQVISKSLRGDLTLFYF